MFRAKRSDELVTYVGHVLWPHVTCTGTVEVWDQTIGCPECGKELWTGKTSEDVFYAEHPFIFEEAHDPGDCMPWDWEAHNPSPPFGGWRFPHQAPRWHDAGYYMPTARVYLDAVPTEHVFPVDTWSNHDPGDA